MARFELRDSDYGLNASLDPMLVLRKMGFTESSIYQEGDIVRVHCPIHRDLVRKSLIVDTREKTFKCQYSSCEAHEGGLLLELVALYYDCSIPEVSKNLFGDDDRSNELLFRGEMFINQGRHAEALPYLEQAASYDPRNEITRCKLAALYLELNRKDDAYREYLNAAESYAVRGELEKTLSIYNILIMLQPGAVKARKELAFLFSRMGRPDAAANQLKWVVDFYMQYGQVKGAQEACEQIIELDPENPMAYLLLAKMMNAAGKRVPAMQAYENAVRKFIGIHERRDAIETVQEALALAPANPRLRELAAQAEALPRGEEPEVVAGAGGEQDFINWLEAVDKKLAMGEDLAQPGALPPPPASKDGIQLPSVGTPRPASESSHPAGSETTEILPEDRRVALCLSDMRDLTPDQLEMMRQQLISMFTDVRKTYEDGLLSDWEMRTIKDFYKAFCVAVDQHRRANPKVARA